MTPTDLIKAMAEVIDAQARHIEQLEAGHWVKETRAEMEAARARYEGGEATPIDHGDATPVPLCTYGRDIEPAGDFACVLPEGHGQMHHLAYNSPEAQAAAAQRFCDTHAHNTHNHPDDGTREPACPRCQLDEGGLVALLATHGAHDKAAELFTRTLEQCPREHPHAGPCEVITDEPHTHTFDKGGELRCGAHLWDDRCTLPAGHGQNHHFPDFQPRGNEPAGKCGYTAPDGWDCRLTHGHPWPHRRTGPWDNEASE